MMAKKKPTPEDVEINLLFMATQSFDLILRDIERRMAERAMREECKVVEFKLEKKKQFREYLDSLRDIAARMKRSYDLNEKITQDIYDSAAADNYKSIPIWQLESNEFARLWLLYADRSASEENVNKIHSFIRQLPGDGIITDDVLKPFYLKKSL